MEPPSSLRNGPAAGRRGCRPERERRARRHRHRDFCPHDDRHRRQHRDCCCLYHHYGHGCCIGRLSRRLACRPSGPWGGPTMSGRSSRPKVSGRGWQGKALSPFLCKLQCLSPPLFKLRALSPLIYKLQCYFREKDDGCCWSRPGSAFRAAGAGRF